MGLACKFLQINGLGATIPTAPPVLKFKGDTISVRGEVRQGVAVWIGSGANKAGVQTELLAQRLPSPDRAPVPDAYVSRGFVALEEGDAFEATADLGPGIWALGSASCRPLAARSGISFPLERSSWASRWCRAARRTARGMSGRRPKRASSSGSSTRRGLWRRGGRRRRRAGGRGLCRRGPRGDREGSPPSGRASR